MIKKMKLVLSALILAAAPMLVFSPQASAAGQTCAWTGAGADNKFSTVGNWSNCGGGAPTDGDTVSFNLSGVANNAAGYKVLELVNDSNPELAGVTVTSTSGGSNVYLSQLTLGSLPTLNLSGGGYLKVGKTVAGNPNENQLAPVVVNGSYVANDEFDVYHSDGPQNYSKIEINGTLTVFPSSVRPTLGSFWLDPSVMVADEYRFEGTEIYFLMQTTSQTVSSPISSGANTRFRFGGTQSEANWEMTGPISFDSSVTVPVYTIYSGVKVSFSGSGADSAKLVAAPGSYGTLIVGSEEVEVPSRTIEISDKKPEEDMVADKKTTIILKNGERGIIRVGQGGVIKGVGDVASLFVYEGGIVAPGYSPGCITAGRMTLYGEYQFELGGSTPCESYDQIKITGEGVLPGDPDVTIDDSTAVLSTVRFNGYTPKQGEKFIIISQTGDKAVDGTFKNLPEGATFEQNGIVFKISYVGGDGNDVELTVMNQPTVPNTGFELVKNNPLLVLGITAVVAVALVVMGRRLSPKRR